MKKYIMTAAAAAGLGALVAWRMLPPQVVTKTETKVVQVRDEAATKIVYRTIVKKPDGSSTTTETERTDTVTRDTTKVDHKNTVAPAQPGWRATALVGAPVRLAVPVVAVGGVLEKRLVGPVSAGIWAVGVPAEGHVTAGLSLSLTW